jgi:hypothetical protein
MNKNFFSILSILQAKKKNHLKIVYFSNFQVDLIFRDGKYFGFDVFFLKRFSKV